MDALGAKLISISGDYFGPAKFLEMHGFTVKVKSNKRSYDTQAARRLWELSEKLTGVLFYLLSSPI